MDMIKDAFTKKSSRRLEIIDMTSDLNDLLGKHQIDGGIINVFARHSTAGIVINENESRLIEDFQNSIERLIPENKNYGHDQIDNNADAHIRTFFIGSSQTIPFKNNRLELGTWQSVFFVELDGPRTRTFAVTIMGK